jgi:hypothetical protein
MHLMLAYDFMTFGGFCWQWKFLKFQCKKESMQNFLEIIKKPTKVALFVCKRHVRWRETSSIHMLYAISYRSEPPQRNFRCLPVDL